jgi:hypothetical protein
LENDCEYAGLWENIVWGSREEKGGRGVVYAMKIENEILKGI